MHSYASDLAAVLEADLVASGWDGVVTPYPGQSSRQYAMMALHRSLLKKFHNNETSDERDARALAKFHEANAKCLSYQTPQPSSTLEAYAYGEARDFLTRFCFQHDYLSGIDESILSLYKIDVGCGFGPGANIGARSGDPYGKLAISRLTYTDPALLVLFKHTLSYRSLWAEQEQFRSHNFPTDQVQGSKLSFVPKSSEITRTICTEPLLNMFFQKGIASVFERRLNEVSGIDLSLQPDKNRELSRRGSITGEFGTIDLSSASDSMSIGLVRDWFPPLIVWWLELTRSKVTTLKSGNTIDLQMISSMGNAYTFPLQTIFFTSLVVGAYRALDLPIEFPRRSAVGNFAVFGDDIIVRREAYDLVVSMLTSCGFTVNNDKSFNTGLFRESCGQDWYDGHNVRGVYLQKLLDDLDIYSAFNRLSHWSARWGVLLVRSLSLLKSWVRRVLVVPFHEDDESGFKVPLWFAQRITKHSDRPRPHKTGNGSISYLCARRYTASIKIPESESISPAELRRIRRRVPHWRYCPAGILLLMLHGSLRDGRVLLRSDGGPADYRRRHSPCWDSVVFARSERARFVENLSVLNSLVWYDQVTSP